MACRYERFGFSPPTVVNKVRPWTSHSVKGLRLYCAACDTMHNVESQYRSENGIMVTLDCGHKRNQAGGIV